MAELHRPTERPEKGFKVCGGKALVLRNEDGIEDLEIKTKAVVMKRSSRLHELLGSLRPGARPLEGKSVYMHAVKSRHSAGIADVIRRLGGSMEAFLNRDVSFVVTERTEGQKPPLAVGGARAMTSAGVKSMIPPSITSLGGAKLMRKEDRSSRHANPSPVAPQCGSRGRALLEKAMHNTERCRSNDVLTSARSWGVKILFVDDFMWCLDLLTERSKQKRRPQTKTSEAPAKRVVKAGMLKAPFIKVEDNSRRYRPLYMQSLSLPELNYRSRFSPFELPTGPAHKSKHSPRQGVLENRKASPHSSAEQVASPSLKPPRRKSPGYCECCQQAFTDQEQHVKTEQHLQFAEDSSNYAVVDELIGSLDCPLFIRLASSPDPQLSSSQSSTSDPKHSMQDAHTHTHSPTKQDAQTHTHTHSPTKQDAQTHTHTHSPTKQDTQTHSPTKQDTQTHTHTHSPTKQDTQTHTHTHSPTKQDTQTHTHTHSPTKQDTQTHTYVPEHTCNLENLEYTHSVTHIPLYTHSHEGQALTHTSMYTRQTHSPAMLAGTHSHMLCYTPLHTHSEEMLADTHTLSHMQNPENVAHTGTHSLEIVTDLHKPSLSHTPLHTHSEDMLSDTHTLDPEVLAKALTLTDTHSTDMQMHTHTLTHTRRPGSWTHPSPAAELRLVEHHTEEEGLGLEVGVSRGTLNCDWAEERSGSGLSPPVLLPYQQECEVRLRKRNQSECTNPTPKRSRTASEGPTPPLTPPPDLQEEPMTTSCLSMTSSCVSEVGPPLLHPYFQCDTPTKTHPQSPSSPPTLSPHTPSHVRTHTHASSARRVCLDQRWREWGSSGSDWDSGLTLRLVPPPGLRRAI